jgi:Polysaccharide biosynthesis protein
MTGPGVKQPPGSEVAATIRDRGAVGAVLLTARQAAAQVVAFIGTLVLAHLLTPTALGIVAFGTTIVTVGTFFADGGLAPRWPAKRKIRPSTNSERFSPCNSCWRARSRWGRRPSDRRRERSARLRRSWPARSRSWPSGHRMRLCLERAHDYPPIAATELAESLVLYGWAIATVEIGWGVFGVASAAIASALTGSVLMSVASPIRLITPRLALRTLRSMLGFGIGFQAVGLAALARTQGVNLVVVAVGGRGCLVTGPSHTG